MELRVLQNGWGEARIPDIERVLASAAQELLVYFPNIPKIPIVVRHDAEGPLVSYDKGPNGEYDVLLSAQDTYWAQYAFQFSHELLHILSIYDRARMHANKWFEEALCQAASVFAIDRMAITWETVPPYDDWANYASALRSYAEHHRNENWCQLPSNAAFTSWYHSNESQLRTNPYLRGMNGLVANQLLQLLERSPRHWEAVRYLNLWLVIESQSLEKYLLEWYRHSPEQHKEFIRTVAGLFGFSLAYV